MSAAVALASTTQDTLAALGLPSTWKFDRTLSAVIPKSLDWRCFIRLPVAPRYAISVVEPTHVFDLQKRRIVAAFNSVRNRRLRVRLDCGEDGAIIRPYVSRLVLSVTDGIPHQKRMQAHHKDGDTSNNGWKNLQWTTPARNRKIENLRPRQRTGEDNSNCKIPDERLTFLVDLKMNSFKTDEYIASYFKISRQQVWRLLNGESRAAEVLAAFRYHKKNPPKLVLLAAEDPKAFEEWKRQNKKTRAPRQKKRTKAKPNASKTSARRV